VQTLANHNELVKLAKAHGVVCFVEHHKRYRVRSTLFADVADLSCSFDPVYSDARARAAALGEMNFFSAWMSQPKSQLTTFKAWAGKDSDIRSVGRA
jgi:D-galacturonate reductase